MELSGIWPANHVAERASRDRKRANGNPRMVVTWCVRRPNQWPCLYSFGKGIKGIDTRQGEREKERKGRNKVRDIGRRREREREREREIRAGEDERKSERG